jgi:hypothetical protein
VTKKKRKRDGLGSAADMHLALAHVSLSHLTDDIKDATKSLNTGGCRSALRFISMADRAAARMETHMASVKTDERLPTEAKIMNAADAERQGLHEKFTKICKVVKR